MTDRQPRSDFQMSQLGVLDRSRRDRLCVTEVLQWALAAVSTGQACAQSKSPFPAGGPVNNSTQIGGPINA